MNEQGTPEWMADRCGKITASRIADVLAKPRKGNADSSTRRNYIAELVGERLTKKSREGFQTWDMKRGTELEPFARNEYEMRHGLITNVGFIPHPRFPFAGCSPDGLVGKDGMVEFKCPKLATHLEWLRAMIVPTEHRPQMQFGMACAERQWDDFCSYHPDLPDHLQLFVVRLSRDEVQVANIEQEIVKLNAEVDELIRGLPSSKSMEERLAASIEQVKERKAAISSAISAARDPEADLPITKEDVEFAQKH